LFDAPVLVRPAEMIARFRFNRQLIPHMSKREAGGRHHGSIMGLTWLFFNLLLMLVVYIFILPAVLKARLGIGTGDVRQQMLDQSQWLAYPTNPII
jgi:ABC-type polysaccharide/polyol phosphate export permease